MKFIYTLLAIVAMAAFASCTDTDPQPITTIKCEASVAEVTPAWVTFALKVDSDNEDIIKKYYASIVDSNEELIWSDGYFSFEDGQSVGSTAYVTVHFRDHEELKPGNTYTYQIVASVGLSHYNRIILDEGTFTIPTIEEYFGGIELEETLITDTSAIITVNLPDDLRCNSPRIAYSTSQDMSNVKEVKASEVESYNYQNLTFILDGLQKETTYYVTLRADYYIILLEGKAVYNGEIIYNISDVELQPSQFKTASEGQMQATTTCRLIGSFVLDNSASISINVPIGWTLYKEYTNAPVNCTVIYSTDPSFKDYIDLNVKPSSYDSDYELYTFSANLTDLTPETTYYVALKGDFECTQVNQVLKDYIMPANKSFTTRHANQVEMIDGHEAVDLGLSVKWATENVFDGGHQYFAWPEVSGIKDIAGTEDDIARKYWGDSWQMPSKEQFMEMLEKCNITKANDNSIYIWGPNGNYIRIYGDGDIFNGESHVTSRGSYYYWTSTVSNEYRHYGMAFIGYGWSDISDALHLKRFDKLFRGLSTNNKIPVRAVTKK